MANVIKGTFSLTIPLTHFSQSLSPSGSTAGYLQGINLGGPTSIHGDSTFGRHLQYGVVKNTSDGSPGAPSLSLADPGFWRFRWVLRSGTRTISIKAKQKSNLTPRPSLIIKANPSIGINNDVSGSAPSGADWVTIGPVTVTPTGTDVVWVELWNNVISTCCDSASFDHIVVT